MSARRTDMHRLQELVRLHRIGGSTVHDIARMLGMSPNTERLYRNALKEVGLLTGPVRDLPELAALRSAVEAALPLSRGPQEVSTAEPWRDSIAEMMERGAGPKAIYDTLKREQKDFDASPWAVKRFCQRLRKQEGVRAEDVVIRMETDPGKQAQVDFGYVGRLLDPATGVHRKAWVFVMTLSYSRHQFARVVFDQRASTWQQLHVQAFAAFGGVPAVIRPDNLKAAVVRAAFGASDEPTLNRSYRELARHYGFKVDPTPPFQPKKKGKVEAGVRYVKGNFFKPLEGALADIDDANERLEVWVRETAGTRDHGTTGWAPLAEFEERERSALISLPARPYRAVTWKRCRVREDCHVTFERRRYPVPWRFIGHEAWLRAHGKSIEIYIDDERVITHERDADVPEALLDRCLPEGRRDYRHRDRGYWEERADAISAAVGAYIRSVFDSDDVLSMLPTVQRMVGLLERHPVERAVAACRRAEFYASYGYTALKKILEKGLDLQPLPIAVSPPFGTLESPRYARTTAELLRLPLESQDEHH